MTLCLLAYKKYDLNMCRRFYTEGGRFSTRVGRCIVLQIFPKKGRPRFEILQQKNPESIEHTRFGQKLIYSLDTQVYKCGLLQFKNQPTLLNICPVENQPTLIHIF